MTTVAEIAAEAFTAVDGELTDVIKVCTVTSIAQGAYNATTGSYAETPTAQTGRAVQATAADLRDIFPDYVAGPEEAQFFLEGLTTAPTENNTLVIGGVTRTITRVGDIAGAGTFFAVIAV